MQFEEKNWIDMFTVMLKTCS